MRVNVNVNVIAGKYDISFRYPYKIIDFIDIYNVECSS